MLVLSRKKDEKIIIGDKITVMVIEIRGDKVRLGIDAPREITVHRQEVYEAIKREISAAKELADKDLADKDLADNDLADEGRGVSVDR